MSAPRAVIAELKPCPFCGRAVPEMYGVQVICEGCGAGTMVHDTADAAIAAWNRRTPPAIRDDENHKATVDPASTVYGVLLHRHREEARRDFFGVRRAQLFDFIEAYRGEFPSECQAWEDRLLIKEDGADE